MDYLLGTMSTTAHHHTHAHPSWIAGLDRYAIGLSGLCMVHCLSMPLLAVAAPALGVGFDHDHGHGHLDAVHATLLWVISMAVLVALVPGYLRHRQLPVLALGIAGLASFVAALFVLGPRFGHGFETAGAVLSGVLLMAAHYRNRRATHASCTPAKACC